MNVRIFAAWALVIVALAAVPLLVHDSFYLGIATHTLVLAILALSLNVLIGHAGMTSLGHAVYLGIPAYACAWLATRAGWSAPATIACAMLLGTATSALFGVLALRASGLGFLMITLALGQVMWGIAYRWVDLTGGDNGIRLDHRPVLLGFDFTDPVRFYELVAAALVVALFCLWQLDRSPYGACLRGTRDQPRRMRMLGHDVWRIRYLAFITSGFWGSAAGVLYCYDYQYVSPQTLSLPQSAETLLMVVLGGAGTLGGPVLGAVIITVIKTIVSSYVDRWYSLLGLIFIVVVSVMPRGIVPGVRAWIGGRRA
jgi:branched-chain amino acid transport system permease protein